VPHRLSCHETYDSVIKQMTMCTRSVHTESYAPRCLVERVITRNFDEGKPIIQLCMIG
jgi:hypothetical protein